MFHVLGKLIQQVKNPKKSLPWGIGITLSLSCALYMLLSFVVVGLVPYYKLDEDTPISSAFSVYGMNWAAYIVTTGAVMALLATLMGSLLPQSRILMAMARDGLLPSFFADVNKYTHVPVKGTIATGVLAATLAFFMDVSTLAGMVSVGTLLAFTAVAVSLLIVRYIPPYEVPNQSFAEESSAVDGDHQNLSQIDEHIVKGLDDSELLLEKREAGYERPRFQESCLDKPRWQRRRKSAGWFIRIVCIGILIIASTASVESISSLARIALCSLGGVIFLGALAGLAYIGQDDAANQFGRKGGFICPFVPYLPAACALINTYLLINIGIGTMIRVSVWLVIGALVYLLYGRTHSSLSGI